MHKTSLRLFKSLNNRALILILVLLAQGISLNLNGQFKPSKVTRSTNIMIQDGKKYYMHEVKEGHTLYSVSRAYSVSQKTISQENPDVPNIASGVLPLGAVIRIPYVEAVNQSPESEKDYDRFYYHIVEPKETLSSLSRQYKVHYKRIIEYNPGVEDNLPIGLEVKIPKTQVAAVRESYSPPDTVYVYHRVIKGENTISLAGKYGIRIKDLRDANPGMRWGLTEDEIIRIPKDLVTNTEVLVEPVDDTVLFPLDDSIKIISLKEEKPDSILLNNSECGKLLKPHDSEVFEVAFLLPLYLNINDTLHRRDTIPHSPYDIYDVRFLEFLEGAYMAIDSMKSYGIRMNVHVFDTERDPMVVDKLFREGRLNNADLIIGPVYSRPLTVASGYSRMMEIPIISPLSNNGIGLNDNPFMIQVNPGEDLQFQLASIYLADFYNANMIMVQDTSSLNPVARKKGSKIFDYLTYRVTPQDLLSGKILFHPAFSEGLPEKAVMAPVEDMLSIGRKNLVMIPSDNEIFVTDIVNKLNALALYYDITVFGRPEWGSFEALELEYLYNLNFQYYTNFSNPYVNYSDSLTNDFCRKYRENWNNEPSRFSFQGFDISYYFFRALYYYGRDFLKCMDCLDTILKQSSMQTDFCFHRAKNGPGFENQALSIIMYDAEKLSKEKIRTTVPAARSMSQEWQP